MVLGHDKSMTSLKGFYFERFSTRMFYIHPFFNVTVTMLFNFFSEVSAH